MKTEYLDSFVYAGGSKSGSRRYLRNPSTKNGKLVGYDVQAGGLRTFDLKKVTARKATRATVYSLDEVFGYWRSNVAVKRDLLSKLSVNGKVAVETTDSVYVLPAVAKPVLTLSRTNFGLIFSYGDKSVRVENDYSGNYINSRKVTQEVLADKLKEFFNNVE